MLAGTVPIKPFRAGGASDLVALPPLQLGSAQRGLGAQEAHPASPVIACRLVWEPLKYTIVTFVEYNYKSRQHREEKIL